MKLYTTLSVLGCFLVSVACTQETTEQRSASGRAPAESRTTKQTTPLPPRSEDANNQTNEDQDSTAVAAKFTVPLIFPLFAGEVMLTVGATVSLFTFTTMV